MTAPQRLVAAGGLLLVLLALGCWLALRVQARDKRFRARVAAFATPYARVDPQALAPRATPGALAAPTRRAALRLARVFGFDPANHAVYLVRWWIVVPFCLALARGIGGMLAELAGPIAYAAIPLVWLMLTRGFFRFCENRRAERLYEQFPDALAMIVRSVRIGIPVAEGIRIVSRDALPPTAGEFAKVADQISVGMALEDALADLSRRNRLPEYRFFATALSLQARTGGGLAETLDNLADVIRKRVALKARAHALASEARTSIFILAALPFLAGLALSVLNPAYIAVLFGEGRNVLAMAALSLGCGIFSMRFIIKKSLS